MDARPEMDVVFMAHTGLEGANRLEHFIKGALYKRRVKVKFWRVEAKNIPSERDARIKFLQDQWSRMDEWVLANRED